MAPPFIQATHVRELPWWIQAITVIGFPALVALILLGMLTGYVASPITQTAAMMAGHVTNEETRTRLIRVMCRHQASALNQNPDECDAR